LLFLSPHFLVKYFPLLARFAALAGIDDAIPAVHGFGQWFFVGQIFSLFGRTPSFFLIGFDDVVFFLLSPVEGCSAFP